MHNTASLDASPNAERETHITDARDELWRSTRKELHVQLFCIWSSHNFITNERDSLSIHGTRVWLHYFSKVILI